MTEQNKNKVISAVATALIMLLIVLICWSLGLYKPNPPIPEAGVEVNLGNSDFGLGDAIDPSSEEFQQMASSSPSAQEQVITQSQDQTVSINAAKETPKAKPQEAPSETKTTTKESEPKTNNNALFKKKSTTTGGSEGVTQGNGNQGKEGGDPNSKRYNGDPGLGGSGWSLTGRTNLAMPKPQSSTKKQGKIIVKIWVDKAGNVTKSEAPEKGSTITDGAMVEQAKSAAMKAKFSESKTAPDIQTGTITYVYTLE